MLENDKEYHKKCDDGYYCNECIMRELIVCILKYDVLIILCDLHMILKVHHSWCHELLKKFYYYLYPEKIVKNF